jgi:predicted transcriptional regulator
VTSAVTSFHRGLMLLSMHPQHVQSILTGSKTVELRRTRPNVQPGQPVAIYATAPTGAIVAMCRVGTVMTGTVVSIGSSETLMNAAVSREEFDEYFCQAEKAVAIHLRAVRPLTHPVTLEHLRSERDFHPPQTWHFVDLDRIADLFGTHAAHAEVTSFI